MSAENVASVFHFLDLSLSRVRKCAQMSPPAPQTFASRPRGKLFAICLSVSLSRREAHVTKPSSLGRYCEHTRGAIFRCFDWTAFRGAIRRSQKMIARKISGLRSV